MPSDQSCNFQQIVQIDTSILLQDCMSEQTNHLLYGVFVYQGTERWRVHEVVFNPTEISHGEYFCLSEHKIQTAASSCPSKQKARECMVLCWIQLKSRTAGISVRANTRYRPQVFVSEGTERSRVHGAGFDPTQISHGESFCLSKHKVQAALFLCLREQKICAPARA